MGIEPTSSAWKAEVLAVELHPQTFSDPNNRYFQNRKQRIQTPTRRQHSWWRGEDSNLRRLSQQIYSLPPLTAREPLRTENPHKR